MYFHNGNHIQTTTFHNHDCLKEYVYVSGLNDNEYLLSKHPYVLVRDNGVVIAIDHTFSFINHFDQNHQLISTYTFDFITECPQNPTILQPHDTDNHLNDGRYFLLGFVVFLILIAVIIKRRFL